MRGMKWSICTKYVVMGSTESEGDKQLLNNFQMPKQELNIFYFPNLQTPPGYDHYHSEKDRSASSFTTRVHHRYTTGQDFPHHTCICTVSHETHGITHTCGSGPLLRMAGYSSNLVISTCNLLHSHGWQTC